MPEGPGCCLGRSCSLTLGPGESSKGVNPKTDRSELSVKSPLGLKSGKERTGGWDRQGHLRSVSPVRASSLRSLEGHGT